VAEATPQDTSAEASERVADLTRRLDSLRQKLQETTLIKSPCSGEAVELKTYLGAPITVGSPLITIQPPAGTLEALAYIPGASGYLVDAGARSRPPQWK